MKKSLAPPHRDKPMGSKADFSRKNQTAPVDPRSPQHIDRRSLEKKEGNQFEDKYRNKNISVLPTQMLIAFSELSILDISYNKLNDAQIEIIMNSCLKLATFCIQGNQAVIIPAVIWKLKNLVNFRHDWLLERKEMYESDSRLKKLKIIAKKPQTLVKVNRIVGIDFGAYCKEILIVPLDATLNAKIEKSDNSPFAKENMTKFIISNLQLKEKAGQSPIREREEKNISGCFGCNFDEGGFSIEIVGHPASITSRMATDEPPSKKIIIEDIRDMSQTEFTSATDISNNEIEQYTISGMPLHKLFSTFDRNTKAPSQIDGLLLQRYNPNQYDQLGLSPYHICIIHKQVKGFDYLIDISSNNPGFFDLEMPSIKEGRNILHLCVFLKNFEFAKKLIQFGIPTNKRDSNGARIQHLVDHNYEFLLLLRKLMKKKTRGMRTDSSLAIPLSATEKKKMYTKHPLRLKQQSKFRNSYSKNDKLMQQYESSVGFPK